METNLSPDEMQAILQLRGSGAIGPGGLNVVALRQHVANAKAGDAAQASQELLDEKKERLGRIIAQELGDSELQKFMDQVNIVEPFVAVEDLNIATGSLYLDQPYNTQALGNDRYQVYCGAAMYLHNGAFAPIPSGVQLQLMAAQVEVSRGKDKSLDNLAKYLKGGNPHIATADFAVTSVLNGAPLSPVWDAACPNGMQWHEVFPLGAAKPNDTLQIKVLTKGALKLDGKTSAGITVPAQGVATVNLTLITVGYNCFLRGRK